MSSFQLLPFPGEDIAGLTVTGEVRRSTQGLELSFTVAGPLHTLLIPEAAGKSERHDNLWQATCLELFIARTEGHDYLECNLSPAGHWNLYAFSDYRVAMRPVVGTPPLTVHCHPSAAQLTLSACLPLPTAFCQADGLRLGPSAILLHQHGKYSHWALDHPRPQPDFHAPESRVLRL